jgi:hypothetical protein
MSVAGLASLHTSRAKVDSRRALLASVMAAAFFVALGIALEVRGLVNHDVAWILWLAGQVLDGRVLYRDLIEVNPPLIVWLNLPVMALAHAIGMDAVAVFRLALAALLLVSGFVTYVLLPASTTAVLAAFVLTILPASATGQREHLAVALLLPFLALAARRRSGLEVSRPMAAAIGIAAGLGIALKPFLAPVWLFVALYRRPAREDAFIAAVGVAYVLAVLALTPDYLPLVRDLAPQYLAFGHKSTTAILAMLPSVAILVLTIVWLRTRGRSPVADVGLLASGGAVVAVLLQQKGWDYHWLPAIAFAVLAAPAAIQTSRRRLPMVAASSLLAWTVGQMLWQGQEQRAERLERAAVVHRLAKGHDRVLMLTANFIDVWPGVGHRWAGSLPCLWWTVSPPASDSAERLLMGYVRRDLAQRPPIVLVETPARHYQVNKNTRHPLAVLGPLAGYRMVDSAGGLTAWVPAN